MDLSSEKYRINTNEQRANGNVSGNVKDDSATKFGNDDESQSIGGSVCNKFTFKDSSFSFEGVRFTPKVIEFVDALEGKHFAVNINIQNTGKIPVFVRIGEPSSFIFQLKKHSRRKKLLASGASITRTVTYSYHNDDLVQSSRIPVEINGRLVDYPIIVKRATPEIEVQPNKLDFKFMNLGASAKTLMLTIQNTGGKRTRFEIDVGKNNLDLAVSPIKGVIRAKSQTKVTVEMMGLNEGEYYKELWITSNEKPIRVPILAEVVRPRLEIVHCNGTQDFTLINFQPTFNGTQRASSFVLKNYSAEPTLFITLAENDGNLQLLNDARKVQEEFNMFKLTGEEGRLEAGECRIMTVLFRPKAVRAKKGWHHQESEMQQWDHIVFFRINRVHCIERKELAKVVGKRPIMNSEEERSKSIMQSLESLPMCEQLKSRQSSRCAVESRENEGVGRMNNYLSMNTFQNEKVLRLCLHGKAVEPDILVQPSNLDFGELKGGQKFEKVLRITNRSIIAIKFKLSKPMDTRITPSEGWLKAEKAKEVLVSVTPTCAGKFNLSIRVEIFAKSDVVFEKDKSLVMISDFVVPICFILNLSLKIPRPKIGLGISPLMTDEVGFQKELVTFSSTYQKPYTAMLLSMKQNTKPEWMKKESDKLVNVDNAVIAFPNDRPHMYYAWPKEKICRTIFKGFFRYSPPEDNDYTLTTEEKIQKKQHNALWSNYIELLKELRRLKYPNMEEVNRRLVEYDLSCSKHYNMTSYKINLESSETVKRFMKKRDVQPRAALVPLSPMYLSSVNVEPKLINFNMVPCDTITRETLTIENMNPFPISIRFIPGKSAVSVLEGATIIIQPVTRKTLQITFQTKELGRYFGFLNYVINGSHEFKITISAFVTLKTLTLDGNDLFIVFGNYPQKSAFQPRSRFLTLGNVFHSPIKYSLRLPHDSSFVTNLIEGEVPPRSHLLAELMFDLHPMRPFYSEVSLVSESGNIDIIKLIHPNKKIAVNFLTQRIDMQDISLNFPTKATPVIQNVCYHDVVFEVTEIYPMPGVVVEPKLGIIKARSFFPLEVSIQIPVVMKFSFEVVLLVHLHKKLSVRICGNVVVPVIRIKPSEINMRPICAQSFDEVSFCVENVGNTPAEIEIDFKGCPEYKLVENCPTLLLPKSCSKLVMKFEPEDVVLYDFYLPIIINKILGPPMMQLPETEYLSCYISDLESEYEEFGQVVESVKFDLKIPCVCINCVVSPSLIKISPLNVNFRLLPNSRSEFQQQNIVISNEFVEKVTFCIRNDDLGEDNDSPFVLLPVKNDTVEQRTKSIKAELKPREKLVLEAKFQPTKCGIFAVDIPIFVKGYSNGLVYNYIKLKGELQKPRLYSELNEIHFPPLPLDVGCEAIITLCAENYRSPCTISCCIWDPREGCELTTQCLTTTWIDDPNVVECIGIQTFRVQVNFQSSFPIAFETYLLFADSDGEYCTVFVTAVSDNSAVTTHAFLTTRSLKYKIVRDNPPNFQEVVDNEVNKADKAEAKVQKGLKKGKSKSNSSFPSEVVCSDLLTTSNVCPLPVDKSPRLVIQVTKSMSRPTQLSFVNLTKHVMDRKNKESRSTSFLPTNTKILNSLVHQCDTINTTRISLSNEQREKLKESESENDVTHPFFPNNDTAYEKHFQKTLTLVERWIFEVVMRCDQYFTIPKSFHKLQTEKEKSTSKGKKNKSKSSDEGVEKDFLDLLEEILGDDSSTFLPKRVAPKLQTEKAECLKNFYCQILRFLQNQGCLLPHIKPEFLLDYDDYICSCQGNEIRETFRWRNLDPEKTYALKLPKEAALASRTRADKDEALRETSSILYPRESWKNSLFEEYSRESEYEVNKMDEGKVEEAEAPSIHQRGTFEQHSLEGKQISHKVEPLDKQSFEARSTQAWLDIILQIFRTFVLTRIVHKNTVPPVTVIEMGDQQIVENVELISLGNQKKYQGSAASSQLESFESNLYTFQERMLLMWLNYHYHLQKDVFWRGISAEEFLPTARVVNNFDKDLADSLVLIAVTAAHCPYANDFLSNIFVKPDTPNKMYHNAGKLVLLWRMLNLGLTVESADIVKPNIVFMIMLVAQLYETLPSLSPRSVISFTSPLTSEVKRTVHLKNNSQKPVFYEAKFLGEYEGIFRLSDPSPLIEVMPSKTVEIKIIFTARKIKKVTATLLLFGSVISPNFATNLVFLLQGEPSELTETDEVSLTAPLYQVICTEIPINSPYTESTTYEIQYTTQKPVYKDTIDISSIAKPWSEIVNRKISRRLFLNKSKITFDKRKKLSNLSVTIACMTDKPRLFWLLFRNPKIGDFIILISIKPKGLLPQISINAEYSDAWFNSSECICVDADNQVSNCPLMTYLMLPTRNERLWDCLRNMFLKALHFEEKSFWEEHFEMSIGIWLIIWLLSADEEEEVLDEFVHFLQTKVSYNLKVEPPKNKYVSIPEKIELPDVRERSEFRLPVHISSEAPGELKFVLTMTSENGKEIRRFRVSFSPHDSQTEPLKQDTVEPKTTPPECEPCRKGR